MSRKLGMPGTKMKGGVGRLVGRYSVKSLGGRLPPSLSALRCSGALVDGLVVDLLGVAGVTKVAGAGSAMMGG